MSASRASMNAKLVQRHQKQQRALSARSLSEKFTQKQSHFSRRLEEDQVRQMQLYQSAQGPGTALTGSSGVNQGLLSRRGAAAWDSAAGSRSTPSPDAFDAMGPLSIAAAAAPAGVGQAPRARSARTTTAAATFGIDAGDARRAGQRQSMGVGVGVGRPAATRTTRRTERFRLPSTADRNAKEGEEERGERGLGSLLGAKGLAGGGGGALGTGLLGVVRPRADEGGGLEGLPGGGDADEAAPPRKLTRAERFREMLANSKKNRAQTQRARAEQDDETKALDQEINTLMHLLPRRSKEEEERQAFERAGTAEVRALLQSYKKGHVAKQLVLKSSGEFTVAPLVQSSNEESDGTAKNSHTQPTEDPKKRLVKESAGKQVVRDPFLDENDRELLKKIRTGASDPVELVEGTDSQLPIDNAPQQPNPTDNSGWRAEKEDDFDHMMNLMRLDTRRAHATERTLTEEEQAELNTQQALLEMDRQGVPSLGLQEQDQMQLTRAEWIQQGGDRVFHMDNEEEEGDLDGNKFDIPSSYEADSRAGSEEVESDDNTDDDGAAAEKKNEKSTEVVLGSRVLDQIMSEIEALATAKTDGKSSPIVGHDAESQQDAGNVPHDQSGTTKTSLTSSLVKAYSQLLVRLHHHAQRHVLEVTNTFRAILIEAERSFLRGQRRGLSRPLLLCLLTITKIFPMSDYRHEVVTPFYIFMCSTLMQMKLESLESVHSYVGLNAILVQGLRSGKGKFAAEALVAAFNVLALQLPRTALEPAKYQGLKLPLPLVERCEAALLANCSTKSAVSTCNAEDIAGAANSEVNNRWNLLEAHHSPENLLLCAYHQLDVLADLYRGMAAFPAIFCGPFEALDRLLCKHHPAFSNGASSSQQELPADLSQWAAVRRAHEAISLKIANYTAAAEQHRTPLAIRTFRVRPIRQFEPLLAEREENAVKSEIRVIKREVREDKKRVIRHLAAEATVQRRAHEKEQAITEAQREHKYNQVMGQLQAQQHIMKTVDAIMSKAKSRPKKGISGAPRAPTGVDESDAS